MEDRELLGKVPELLLAWYDGNARVLPWREDPSPYRVWVSEIMLQQTRVEAVKPYYERFLAALPTVVDLAAVPEERLLKLWEGLGYYNRARNLQKAARLVVEQYGGELPGEWEALRRLPGVGDYTAGAIASIAFGKRATAVDGNVLRVTARLLHRQDNILDPKVKRRVEEELLEILPQRVGDFNQALMELGALVCLPGGAPLCGRCPLSSLCRACALGDQESLPVKAKAKPRRVEERTVFLLFCGGRAALRRRPETGLLSGLWELPQVPGKLSREEAEEQLRQWGLRPVTSLSQTPPAKHVFTHVEWRMTGWSCQVDREGEGFSWADEKALKRDYPLPSAFRSFGEALAQGLAPGLAPGER